MRVSASANLLFAPIAPRVSQPKICPRCGESYDDATAFWWDPSVAGPDEIRKEGVGMYQFVDGGKRYLPGQWPSVDKMFDPAGAIALYKTPPPGEEPGTYPSPAHGS